MKIDGVLHEFSTIPGVVEDVTNLLLNLKGLPVKLNTDEPKVLIAHRDRRSAKSPPPTSRRTPTSRSSSPTITSPRSPSKTARLSMEIGVEKGRGYVTADRQRNVEHMIGLIPLDSIFSPIRKVNFTVDDTRVGQSVDYDRLDARRSKPTARSPPTMRCRQRRVDHAGAAGPLHRLQRPRRRHRPPRRRANGTFRSRRSTSRFARSTASSVRASPRSPNCLT